MNTRFSGQSFASLHRLLIIRIAIMTVVILAILGPIVYLTQRAGFCANLAERALLSGAHLRVALISELDAPDLGNHASIQAVLDSFKQFRHQATTGQYALLRILDASQSPVAEVEMNGVLHLGEIRELVNTRSHRLTPGECDGWHEVVNIGGKPTIHVALPLANSRNQIVAYAEGVFVVSEEAITRLQRTTLRALLYAVSIVLAIVLLLYPVIIRLMKRIASLSVLLLEANLETINVLGSAIAKRDSDTDLHNYRVTIYSVCLAKKLGLKDHDIRALVKGAFLHDVGKIGIRDNILLKPGRLDEGEYREMKLHVQHGRDIVSRAVWLQDALDVVLSHHEKFDGSGYPLHKGKDEIPIVARLFAIIDVFDALTSRRPYKEPLSFERTMEILEEGRGNHFDPVVLDAFRTIAGDLYEQYANSDETFLKASLESIAMCYFTGDIGELLKG